MLGLVAVSLAGAALCFGLATLVTNGLHLYIRGSDLAGISFAGSVLVGSLLTYRSAERTERVREKIRYTGWA